MLIFGEISGVDRMCANRSKTVHFSEKMDQLRGRFFWHLDFWGNNGGSGPEGSKIVFLRPTYDNQ